MRPVDEAALQTLRKAAGDSVDPAVWAEIEKQAEQRGIDNLTGAAALTVAALVRKHGQPGQPGYSRLHPDSKSGGGSSGSSGESKGKETKGGGSPAGVPNEAGVRLAVLGLKDKDPAAEDRYSDVKRNPPVSVHQSAGLPAGSKGKVVGYNPDDDGQVYVAFDRDVSVGGKRGRVHLMEATFDRKGTMTSVEPIVKPMQGGRTGAQARAENARNGWGTGN